MKFSALSALSALFVAASVVAGAEIPHLRKQGIATQLIVDGQPFVMLSGELHNSTSSSLAYLEPIWPKLVKLHLNTVVASVSWELLEPAEGRWDFTLVDGLLAQARQHRMKLVLIWFASWKNGVSSYVPLWVKADATRFPRAQNQQGRKADVVSPFSANALIADARAYRALMKHLREVDGAQRTVLMMQVQNEVGIKGGPRDFSPLAQQAWDGPVPAPLLTYLAAHKSRLLPETRDLWSSSGQASAGTWQQVFGASEWAEEAFMAWHYAAYIDSIAAEGKREYPLPTSVNAWLQGAGQKPGTYPSGGPVARVMDFWKAGAPAIDVIAPDIYLPEFKAICASYTQLDNPLWIPEAGRGPDAAAKVFYAIAQHNALGFAPFGIDSLEPDHPLGESYRMLADLMPEMLLHQGNATMAGILEYQEENQLIALSGYQLNVNFKSREKKGLAYGLVIATAPDEFLIAGSNFTLTFSSPTDHAAVRIGFVDEMTYRDAQWQRLRRLNGDETGGGAQVKMPNGTVGVQKFRLYRQ